MCKKTINHGIAIIGIAILTFLSVGCWSVPYAGPDADVNYVEYNVRNRQGYFLGYTEDNPSDYWAGAGYKAITFLRIKDNEFQIDSSGGTYIKFNIETVNELYPLFEVRFKNTRPEPSVVYISVHPKDPDKPNENLYFRLDKIEGLMSLEEAQAIVAREEAAAAERAAAAAERTAQEEARRQAREAANRYDPANFIIVPSNFAPANYTSIDLFTAVSNVEQMPRGSGSIFDGVLATREYVSDVVFVSQNGTDIQFRTVDNAISQSMKIDSRSGLTSGQRVRLYYRVSKNPLTEWRVIAIERL